MQKPNRTLLGQGGFILRGETFGIHECLAARPAGVGACPARAGWLYTHYVLGGSKKNDRGE